VTDGEVQLGSIADHAHRSEQDHQRHRGETELPGRGGEEDACMVPGEKHHRPCRHQRAAGAFESSSRDPGHRSADPDARAGRAQRPEGERRGEAPEHEAERGGRSAKGEAEVDAADGRERSADAGHRRPRPPWDPFPRVHAAAGSGLGRHPSRRRRSAEENLSRTRAWDDGSARQHPLAEAVQEVDGTHPVERFAEGVELELRVPCGLARPRALTETKNLEGAPAGFTLAQMGFQRDTLREPDVRVEEIREIRPSVLAVHGIGTPNSSTH